MMTPVTINHTVNHAVNHTIGLTEAIGIASGYSAFVRQQCERYPELLSETDLLPLTDGQMREQAVAQLLTAENEQALQKQLRLFRRHQMVRIAVRDLTRMATLDETLRDTSEMGNVLVSLAYRWVFDHLVKKWGKPIGEETGGVQELIILGMGKLGGQELNYSSDIDLIFVFPEKGQTEGGERSISNEEFFTKVGQLLNQCLNATTADGFVFRVDMRLRPFGNSGALVHSFSAFEHYYQVHGRPWERYAMVKARAMTGKAEDIAELESLLRPFIYRRYVDFTMLDALRDLKRMIALEVHKKGADRDVKLGAGGIREVEFVVQAFQLVHGGQDAQLRGRQLLPMLQRLSERHYLDVSVADSLRSAYCFLRDVENRLQMWADQQTHLLPTEPERLQLLAESLGFDTSNAFMQKLDAHRQQVVTHFESVLGATKDDREAVWLAFWQVPESSPCPMVSADEQAWRSALTDLRQQKQVVNLSAEARERLDHVMPLLLAETAEQSCESVGLTRVLAVIVSVLKRSSYLVLLKESAVARAHLVKLCIASPWLTDYLVKMPSLLDQLLDERQLYAPLSKEALVASLQAQLVDLADEEQFMNVIRRFKHAQVFRTAAADLTCDLSLMHVSDYLTWIAETIVQETLVYAWQWITARHGFPQGYVQGESLPFMVVGFGKLGGLELGYGSDLDMVYLSDERFLPNDLTDGAKPVEHQLFFTRLAQKISSLLSTQTLLGKGYEVDIQLRPHGASGSLVATLAGFFRYEREQAWTWEHQALIRTRAIAGGEVLCQGFEQARLLFLQQTRSEDTLKTEVLTMRNKMRQHLDKSTAERFDVKQGRGGVIDIEFLVQYWVLLSAVEHPAVVIYSDNFRQLTALAQAGVISMQTAQALTQCYQQYRTLAHQQAMSNQEAILAQAVVAQCQQIVSQIWEGVFSSPL